MRLPDRSSRLDLAALFPPQPQEGGLIVAHDDPGVRAADERAAKVAEFGSGYAQ